MGDRVILHSDINCCYASIEHLHHPELAGKPLAVGGDPEARHGIVLTADYIAKKYGVKTGMALWQAKQVCPDITFVSPRMDLYLRFSRMAHEIYAEYTDRQEPYGIDECWLDVTGSSSLKGDGLLIAQEISRRMKSELGITVSVGVSFNKIFAKLGSDYKKPDAITTMYKSEFKQKAWSLPVADLLYVGKSTNRKLALFGIKTIGDLARADEDVLNSHLGKMGSILWLSANGYDDLPVKLENTHAPIKSVGNSTTTPKDLVCDEDVKIVLYILAESVAARLYKYFEVEAGHYILSIKCKANSNGKIIICTGQESFEADISAFEGWSNIKIPIVLQGGTLTLSIEYKGPKILFVEALRICRNSKM